MSQIKGAGWVVLNLGLSVGFFVAGGIDWLARGAIIAELQNSNSEASKILIDVLNWPPQILVILGLICFALLAYQVFRFFGSVTAQANASLDNHVAQLTADVKQQILGELRPATITGGRDAQPSAQIINPLETKFTRKAIRVADLVFDGEYFVVGKTFEECYIYGPAVVAFNVNAKGEENVILNGVFDGDPSSIFIEIQSPRTVLGVIGFQKCRFTDCTFKRVGIIGNKEQIARMSKAFDNGGGTI